ncbi:MAG: glycosyltransferase [Cyclobacteriaceae bacterium]|jgi:poly-beta-1,6-N-acetyl-D-glucosamine synthase|nr:glycosyltransferase [Cyclobacteriaceae bacterium]
MLVYFLLIFGFYFTMLIFLLVGWNRIRQSTPLEQKSLFVSVVIPVRNEDKNLRTLLDTLEKQNYGRSNFEIIFVDDHSTDQSVSILKERLQYSGQRVTIIQSSGTGKKRALATGVEMARGEIVLCTDADCVLPPDWILRMVGSFNSDTQMVVGLVKIKPNNFFDRLQALEFVSVMGTGIAALRWRFPLMCNGASLAFRKNAYEAVQGYEGNFQYASGDDEFLMRKIQARYPGAVHLVQDINSVVVTAPAGSLKGFIHQRLRWAGKWRVNDSGFARLIAIFIFQVQVSWLLLVGLALFNNSTLIVVLIFSKILLEGFFLGKVSKELKQPFDFMAFACLQIVYPFYVIFIGMFSQFLSFQWKGRSLSAAG